MLGLKHQIIVGFVGSTALVAALGIAPAGAASRVHAPLAIPAILRRTATVGDRDSLRTGRAQSEFRQLALAAKNRLEPKIVPQSWTYTVTTTADDTLWSSAPAHHCEDTSNHSLCSFRAALAATTFDFSDGGSSDAVADQVNVRSGDYQLNPSVGGTVFLTPTYSGKLTIEGAGASTTTIDGSANGFDSELLGIQKEDMTVSVSGLTFKHGSYADDAGAIWSSADNTLDVAHCAFLDNYAAYQGGAIGTGEDSDLTVTDSSFTGNNTTLGGGAIFSPSNSEMVLSGDTFTNNTSTAVSTEDDGGAVDAAGSVSVNHSTFSHNSAESDGGALWATGDVVANDDTFLDNAGTGSSEGGAVGTSAALMITNSLVSGNASSVSGGGIAATITYLDGDTFHGNHSSEAAGDVLDFGAATIENSTFTDSYVLALGGSIATIEGSNLTLSNDLFSHDRATADADDDGGGAIYTDGVASLSHVTIESCFAGKDGPGTGGLGGALFANTDAVTTIDQSSIIANFAQYGAGGIDSIGPALVVTASTVNGNTGYGGGGIFQGGAGFLTVNNSTVDANASLFQFGGGISVDGDGDLSQVELTNSTLAFNHADVGGTEDEGGGIDLLEVGIANLDDDTIVNNDANYGGGLADVESNAIMVNTTIADNFSPEDRGSGIYGGLAELTSTSSIISGNAGDQCDTGLFSFNSGGYNVVSDYSCAFNGEGDRLHTNADLGVLASNGGPTQTMEPMSGSPAIGTSIGDCPAADQRGVTIPTSALCDAGAVFVEPTSTTLTLSTPLVTVGHEQLERVTVTVKALIPGSLPTGSVVVSSAGTLLCTATLKPLLGSKTHLYEGSCTLPSNKLKKGSEKLSGLYGDNKALLAGSTSASKTLKVVA